MECSLVSSDRAPSRFVVGIDLGTTNSAMAYVDTTTPLEPFQKRGQAPRELRDRKATGDGGGANDRGRAHLEPLGNAQVITGGNVLGKMLRIDPIHPSLTPGSADGPSSNGEYRIHYGDALFKLGKYADAKVQYTKAKSLRNGQADGRLKKVQAKLGS